ncbi:MAG: LEA type 2 family protein [Planctomycetes bacterium]|nr:LEA type 2 family protein [Planctomycetota bacterium]
MSTRTMFAALALLGTGLLSQGCETFNSILESTPKPTASIKDVRFANASFTKLDLVFDVDVKNPYDVSLPLLNLDYSLTGGQQHLLTGAAPLSGSIPANGSKTVSLPASVSLAEALKFFSGVRPGGTLPYSADLKLLVDAPALGKIPVPISRSGQVKVPNIPGL